MNQPVDGIRELAGLFKQRNNKPYSGPVIGTVLSSPPELTVQHPSGIVLDKSDMIVAAHILRHHRVITLTHLEGTVRQLGDGTGVDLLDTDNNLSPWTTFTYNNIDCEFRDTLAAGDLVILIPTGDGQTFALIDKAVTL